jgi:hypothetical protein
MADAAGVDFENLDPESPQASREAAFSESQEHHARTAAQFLARGEKVEQDRLRTALFRRRLDE